MPRSLDSFRRGIQMSVPGGFTAEDIRLKVDGQKVIVNCLNPETRQTFCGQFDMDYDVKLTPENVDFEVKGHQVTIVWN